MADGSSPDRAARAVLVVFAACWIARADAQDAGPRDAGTATAPNSDAGVSDARVQQLRDLIAGKLSIDVAPQTLFQVPLDDERAIQIEAVRLRALLRAIDRGSDRPDQRNVDAGSLQAEIGALDPTAWTTRLALDRARLSFFELPREQREQLLRDHAARRQVAKPHEAELERHAREAEEERQRALSAARTARTEAERLVSEEQARLIALDTQVANVREGFRRERAKLSARKEVLLGWQRRVREAKAAGTDAADGCYDALRTALRASRTELSQALDQAGDAISTVPALGPDALRDVPPDIPTAAVRKRRADVSAAIRDAHAEERALWDDQAATLLDEITTLNHDRLSLLPYLTSNKRDAVTGFTLAGWDQASAEAWHLSLILRYQRRVVGDWIAALRGTRPSGVWLWRASMTAIPWLLLIAVFIWASRRSARFLELADARLAQLDRAEHRTEPSPQRRSVRFLGKIHRPLQWAALFLAASWLLPERARGVLEVDVLRSVLAWVLGGALVVNTVNAIAAGTTTTLFHDDSTIGALRLRSLRLVGRTVVVFALILVLSARLVGRGTIFSWVASTCWFAALPVFIVLVRWWRGVVFERMERGRKRSRLQGWVLSNRSGWKSLFAAMIAAVQLFSLGALKTLRSWLTGFDLTRRAHAYLFRREIDRLAEGSATLRPLAAAAQEALHPERAFERLLPSPFDATLHALLRRVGDRRGGVIALIGARGMGKSSALHALAVQVEGSIQIACNAETSAETLRERLGIASAPGAPPRTLTAPLVLLDDAHTLAKPVIGGLRLFDDVVALARAQCTGTTWVMAIDASIWPLLRRARDARPLFDETHLLAPWDEAQIGALLDDRCRAAGITPSYDDLLEKLPAGADEYDRLEALKARRLGYRTPCSGITWAAILRSRSKPGASDWPKTQWAVYTCARCRCPTPPSSICCPIRRSSSCARCCSWRPPRSTTWRTPLGSARSKC